ncbi:hypothetical protein Hypma_006530 [Hypsizygus marmoreus]|uniref:Uncharacterized protein n=1 Tax=Hypsizygus marmoreus TaxID=39966 RepID=A0A369K228_HYPMA|nr:hypothetical protein Hypma_006530 [Hypsizygus marmoreus]
MTLPSDRLHALLQELDKFTGTPTARARRSHSKCGKGRRLVELGLQCLSPAASIPQTCIPRFRSTAALTPTSNFMSTKPFVTTSFGPQTTSRTPPARMSFALHTGAPTSPTSPSTAMHVWIVWAFIILSTSLDFTPPSHPKPLPTKSFISKPSVSHPLYSMPRKPSPPNPPSDLLFTDNTNSVNIFSSLYSLPAYTEILKFFCVVLIQTTHQVRVLHVPGASNAVADALSRAQFTTAKLSSLPSPFHIFNPLICRWGLPKNDFFWSKIQATPPGCLVKRTPHSRTFPCFGPVHRHVHVAVIWLGA